MLKSMLTRPGPVMLSKLSIMVLSNAPKFPNYVVCHNYAPLCPIIMLHKLLLPESKQLKALNLIISTEISTVFNIRQLVLMKFS